jgi:hypothetical protein
MQGFARKTILEKRRPPQRIMLPPKQKPRLNGKITWKSAVIEFGSKNKGFFDFARKLSEFYQRDPNLRKYRAGTNLKKETRVNALAVFFSEKNPIVSPKFAKKYATWLVETDDAIRKGNKR